LLCHPLFLGPLNLEVERGEPPLPVFFPKLPHFEVLHPGGRHLVFQGGEQTPRFTIFNVGRDRGNFKGCELGAPRRLQ
jgi:hypothetical protein